MADELVVGARSGATPTPRRAPTVTSTPTATTKLAERGAVTAEAAAVLPLLLALAWGLLWVICLASAQVRVVDTAREVARAAARGDTAPDVDSGEDPVRVSVTRSGGTVHVVATSTVRGPGGLFAVLPSVELTSTAVAAEEPS